jgi:predicted nuclease of predicted toxin-antitoxin system
MKIVADENVALPIVTRLRQEGHEVMYIAEMAPSIVDEAVLDAATQGDALLLTDDKDFGDLVYRQHYQTLGVLPMRLAKLSNGKKADVIIRVLSQYSQQLIRSFTVVMPGSVRIRKPPTSTT